MTIKSGVDIVYIPRFKKSLKRAGEDFLRRIFNDEEVSRVSKVSQVPRGEKALNTRGARATRDTFIEHLAGIFAAKEAVIKALSLPTNSWHDIHVTYEPDGAPLVEILNHKSSIINHSLSISHDGNYCFAQFIAILCKTWENS